MQIFDKVDRVTCLQNKEEQLYKNITREIKRPRQSAMLIMSTASMVESKSCKEMIKYFGWHYRNTLCEYTIYSVVFSNAYSLLNLCVSELRLHFWKTLYFRRHKLNWNCQGSWVKSSRTFSMQVWVYSALMSWAVSEIAPYNLL